MSTLGNELVQSLTEALAHARGEGPAVVHPPPVSPRDVRLQANLTQAQMAPLMGMSLSGYRKWEQGARNVSGPAETLLRAIRDMVPASRSSLDSSMSTVNALSDKVRVLDDAPDLRHRLRRCISWLQRANEESDADAKCVFLWIAFNAAYAVDRNADFSRTAEEGNEWQCRRSYFAKVVPLDAERIYGRLANELNAPTLKLIGNAYVYHEFWKSLGDEPFDWANWPGRARFDQELNNVDRRLHQYRNKRRSSKPPVRDAKAVLGVLFDRLYVLRNQLMHGCATHQGHLNRQQVRDGALILSSLVPVFLDIMADNPHADWGPISFPVRDDIREDHRVRH